MDVEGLHFKCSKTQHHHETPHTRDAGAQRGQMVQTRPLLISQGHRPLSQPPAAMACVPSPLTPRLHINRRASSSAAHFSFAAQEVTISRQKAQQEKANNMSPSFTTEASQPLPARSTVAQRKQANELRKVRRKWYYTDDFCYKKCFLVYLPRQSNNNF